MRAGPACSYRTVCTARSSASSAAFCGCSVCKNENDAAHPFCAALFFHRTEEKTKKAKGNHIDGDILFGDINDDGQVTAEDARYALRAAVGLDDAAEGLDFSDPANRCYVAANVDGEAGISAADARLILRAAVGLENLG